ncbi:hypothetical protein BU23DRAFT_540360 [Bimuria novae-zelandiae CBS 107.79]|uniref:Restriction of telomere capping protein 4 n=1 Tax=Bimuria novae-zelandiae CBS 107.79 TaxID=1447943 RepID=A0A6A5UXB9_9PLEO|nr:hypothetical protein BU23DRAFT_540360 [Bimuria novae-zelandiae CBS 107.79]
MPALSRRSAPLLRIVGNKPHASSDAHEETQQTTSAMRRGKACRPQMTEEEILADPMSSQDDASAPPTPRFSQGSNKSMRRNTGRITKARAGVPSPGTKSKSIRPPQRGSFMRGLKHKDSFVEEEKENSQEGPSNSGAKRGPESVDFCIEYLSKKKARIPNVHTTPPITYTSKRTFGKQKPVAPMLIPKQGNLSHIDYLDNAFSSEKRYADISDDELPSPAAEPTSALPRVAARYAATSSLPSNANTPETAPSSPLTSLVSSSDDDDDTLQALEQELTFSQLEPEPSPNSICALCQDPVDEDEQLHFWTTHPHRTVRNQMLFCKEHKRSKARKEYKAQGFPEIDWKALPHRIRDYRAELIALLRNETEEESEFRTRHASRLVSGKAAALPSKRAHRTQSQAEKESAEKFDLASSGTGYYGPRGKRVMMETITADLSSDIREVAARDPVVGRSGFAMFVQAVLVPELTILLVMEDCEVGRGVARELVRGSGEVGGLVNEEVEDEVGGGSEEEEEDY